MVEKRKMDYVNSKRLDKPLVALDIIRGWREQKPPGRFLKLDDKTGMWEDVGDKKAREKTSQALREKAPMLRKQQEEILSEQVQPIRLRGVGSSSGSPIEVRKEMEKTNAIRTFHAPHHALCSSVKTIITDSRCICFSFTRSFFHSQNE